MVTGNRGRTSRAELARRHELELRYWLRRLSPAEVQASLREGHGLSVSLRSIFRDFQQLREETLKLDETTHLYSRKKAYMELDEISREGWVMYYQRQPLLDPHGAPLYDKRGNPLYVDDRGIRLGILKLQMDLVRERCILSAYHSRQYAEHLTVFENIAARGVKYELVPVKELLDKGERELVNNEGLRRAEGLRESDD
jgi:hypothetical protein